MAIERGAEEEEWIDVPAPPPAPSLLVRLNLNSQMVVAEFLGLSLKELEKRYGQGGDGEVQA